MSIRDTGPHFPSLVGSLSGCATRALVALKVSRGVFLSLQFFGVFFFEDFVKDRHQFFNVWCNSLVKSSGPGHFFVGDFFHQLKLLASCQPIQSRDSRFCLGRFVSPGTDPTGYGLLGAQLLPAPSSLGCRRHRLCFHFWFRVSRLCSVCVCEAQRVRRAAPASRSPVISCEGQVPGEGEGPQTLRLPGRALLLLPGVVRLATRRVLRRGTPARTTVPAS